MMPVFLPNSGDIMIERRIRKELNDKPDDYLRRIVRDYEGRGIFNRMINAVANFTLNNGLTYETAKDILRFRAERD